jgi:glycosyltransferase involved in cell wall biosynthesis
VDGIRVSYVLSTKNRCAHLERTLANVREFITPADELIVTDGGSTDATAGVAAAFKDIVTVFQSEPDRGEAHGFNKAVLLSRGRIIKPLTDDDYIYPDAMRKAVAALEADEGLDALIAGGEHCQASADGKTGAPVYFHHLEPGQPLSLATMTRVGCGLAFVLRRRVLARVGLFNAEYLLADMDYLARMLGVGCSVKYFDVKLFRHVSYEHSLYERGMLKRDRDWVRLSVRTGRWPEVLGQHSVEALCAAFMVDPADDAAVVLRAVRNLAWMNRRLPWLARAFAGLLGMTRAAAEALRRLTRRSATTAAAAIEPRWDGGLR